MKQPRSDEQWPGDSGEGRLGALCPREQHALRQIERGLRDADPGLAAYLSGRTRRPLVRFLLIVLFVAAPTLLTVGCALRLPIVIAAGAFLAPATPVLGWHLVKRRLASGLRGLPRPRSGRQRRR